MTFDRIQQRDGLTNTFLLSENSAAEYRLTKNLGGLKRRWNIRYPNQQYRWDGAKYASAGFFLVLRKGPPVQPDNRIDGWPMGKPGSIDMSVPLGGYDPVLFRSSPNHVTGYSVNVSFYQLDRRAEGGKLETWRHALKSTPRSNHSGIVHFAFCDGRVQAISEEIHPSVYIRLMTSGGTKYGEAPVGENEY